MFPYRKIASCVKPFSGAKRYLLNVWHDPWFPLARPRGHGDDSLATRADGRSPQEVHLAHADAKTEGEGETQHLQHASACKPITRAHKGGGGGVLQLLAFPRQVASSPGAGGAGGGVPREEARDTRRTEKRSARLAGCPLTTRRPRFTSSLKKNIQCTREGHLTMHPCRR